MLRFSPPGPAPASQWLGGRESGDLLVHGLYCTGVTLAVEVFTTGCSYGYIAV